MRGMNGASIVDSVMTISFTEDAECDGVYVPCKGRNCNHIIEVKIKKGQQIK